MIRLVNKELRQLLPIGYLWLAVLLLGYGIQFFTERVDEETFSSWCEGYCDYNSSTAVAIFSVLLALVTAYSLFPREHDDATIDFLRALPVSKRTVFVAKVLAAWLLLATVTVLSYVIDALVLSTNPESIGGKFYTQVWSTLLWRDLLFAFIVLSHGVLLSWFRTLGLIIYGVYLLGLMWAESYLGTSGDFSIFSLLANEYHGSSLIVNSRALAIHSAVAVLMLLVAYRLWSRTDSSATGVSRSSGGLRILNVFLAAAGFVLLAGVLAYRVDMGTGGSTNQDLQVQATDHYRFVYDASRTEVVDYMVAHAEQDLEKLGELLGVATLPGMRVDLTSESEHAAGLAKWKKIQMNLDAFSEDVSQRRVLSHETTHVLQAVESDRALAENYSAVKFFIEGMAQYTSFEVVPETERRESNWELASVSWHRQKIRFEDLIDANAFSRRFDAELHYSLGDLWTIAMVDICGLSSLGDFMRAAGRKEAVRDLPAALFWRDTTQAIDCDLDTVNAHWRSNMADLYAQVDNARYPAFTDILITRDDMSGQIRISARLEAFDAETSGRDQASGSGDGAVDAAEAESATDSASGGGRSASVAEFQQPARFIVRVGNASMQLGGGVEPVFRGQLVGTGDDQRVEFLVPKHAVQGTRFRYQLGFTPSVDARYYYETWRRGTAPGSAS